MAKAKYTGFIQTPALWENLQFGIQQFQFPQLNLDSFVPVDIPKNIRLGHQMEYVFEQLIRHSKVYEIVVQNLPIRAEKKTLGEIDFILKNTKNNTLIHVELTYKFYIIDSTIEEPVHQLIGPNKHDAFYAKIQKIRNKQFALLHSKEGVKVLEEKQINHQEITHQCCFKAQLFKPYAQIKNKLQPLNETCIVGYWIPFEIFNSPTFEGYSFYMPKKSEWALTPTSNVKWKSHADMLLEVIQSMKNERSPMLWLRKSETEFEKLFVVWWR